MESRILWMDVLYLQQLFYLALPQQAVQAWRFLGKLRLLDFLTTAQYGSRLSALGTGRLYPQKCSWYSFSVGAESTPGAMVWSEGNMSLKNPVTSTGTDPGTVRLVAQLPCGYLPVVIQALNITDVQQRGGC